MTTDDIWTFARDFYGRPGLAPALLKMQDADDIDVPFLLVLLAYAKAGIMLEESDFQSAARHMKQWNHDVIQHVREARRALRKSPNDPGGTLYTQLQQVELAAEEAAIRSAVTIMPVQDTSAPAHGAAERGLDMYRAALDLPAGYFHLVLDEFLDDQRVKETGCRSW